MKGTARRILAAAAAAQVLACAFGAGSFPALAEETEQAEMMEQSGLTGQEEQPGTAEQSGLTGEEEQPGTAEQSGLTEQEEQTGTQNILLIGSDHRNDSWNGNSDVMILATIRQEEQRIILTSFMRDLYADIPGHGVHKLNYAYAVGGAELLEETLTDNYEIEIDNYAVVDFDSMADIVDIVGGVTMEISDAECKWLNGYLNSMEAWDDYLPGGGTYLLNGNQAVAYMRIRFVGNNDYERTQRQRDILKGIFAGAGALEADQLLELAGELLVETEHDFSPMDMMSLLALVPQLPDYELEESRIPYDDLFYSQNEMLVPDFEATIERLHEDLGM